MTIEGTIDTEIEIDPVRETRADPDETWEQDVAIEFTYRECPFSGPIRERELDRKPTAYAVTGRSQP